MKKKLEEKDNLISVDMNQSTTSNDHPTQENTSALTAIIELQANLKKEMRKLEEQKQQAVDSFVQKSIEILSQSANESPDIDLSYEDNKLITVKQAAEFLGIKANLVYQYIHMGKLIPIRSENTRSVKFRKKDLRIFATNYNI